MSRNFIWLPASCFCKISQWHLWLSEFKNHILVKFDDLSYSIEFHWSDEVIQFAFLTTHDQIDELNEVLNRAFNISIINLQPSSISSIYLPSTSPAILIGLYNCNFDPALSLRYRIDHQFSNFMLEVFESEIISEEKLITFSYYLHTTLLKILNEFLNDTYDLFSIISIANGQLAFKKPTKQFNYNQEVMQEIMDYIMLTDEYSGAVEWLNKWTTFVRMQFNGFSPVENEGIEKVYKEIVQLVYRHLGMTDQEEIFLYHMLNKTLWSHFL